MPPKPDPSEKGGEPEAQAEDSKKEEVKDETTKEVVKEAKEEAEKESKEEAKEEETKKETGKEKTKDEEVETEETKEKETKDEEMKTEETKKEEGKEDDMEIDEPADEKEETKEEKKADKKEETTEDKKEEKEEVEKTENDTEKQVEKEENMEEEPEPEKRPKKRGRKSKETEGKKAKKTKGEKAGGDNDEVEAEKTEEAEEGEKEGKRRRRTSRAYVPEDYTTKKDVSQLLPNGRGKKLRDIPAVKACIEKYAAGSEDVTVAYKFLVAGRGKIPKAKAKGTLLDFNGYLTEMVDGEDPKERAKMDEDLESKFSKKAYKLVVPQLKQLVDFFCIDRTPAAEEKADKDFLVERLLDFLSSPSASQVKSSKTPKKEKSRSKSVPPADEEKLPSDEDLRKWVEAYTECHNMKKATMKQAIEIASEKFGVDVTPKKKLMKSYLAESI